VAPGADSLDELPNPERMYGLYASDLRCSFRARSPDERPWNWVARVLAPGGVEVLQRDSTAAASHTLAATARIDVSTLPAGGYDLEVKAWQTGDAGAVTRRARFSVAWSTESWTRNPEDMEDAVHLLLGGDEEENFTRLEPGERESFLNEYWKARDPTPGTAENEALTQFLARIDYANRTYTRPGLQKGMFSDMGRVYIRYGQPDEVLRQVIPAGDETLDAFLDQLAQSENRPATDVRQPGIGGDIRPFEVWIYEGVVPTPLEADPRQKGAVRRRKLTFLFVDEQGFGQYTQRYSTE
jgi:GWxTD domain-containing protein